MDTLILFPPKQTVRNLIFFKLILIEIFKFETLKSFHFTSIILKHIIQQFMFGNRRSLKRLFPGYETLRQRLTDRTRCNSKTCMVTVVKFLQPYRWLLGYNIGQIHVCQQIKKEILLAISITPWRSQKIEGQGYKTRHTIT